MDKFILVTDEAGPLIVPIHRIDAVELSIGESPSATNIRVSNDTLRCEESIDEVFHQMAYPMSNDRIHKILKGEVDEK